MTTPIARQQSIPRPQVETGSLIVDRTGSVLGFDQGLEFLTGWQAAEVVGHRKKLERVLEATAEAERQIIAVPLFEGRLATAASGSAAQQLRFNCRDGSSLLAEVAIERLSGTGERKLVKVLRVLARTAPSIPLGDTKSIDDLTGLLDRNGFVRRLTEDLARAAERSRPLALIVADVDHLRNVNDALGHARGDEVLRKLAGILRVTFGDETRTARLMDDEFAVIMTNAGRGDARQLAASLRSSIEQFRFFDRRTLESAPRITLSIGAASFPADADTTDDLMDRAYDALDEARSLGRNRVWCYVRRPRVPVEMPVYFDAVDSLLVGYSRDLSPSGIFVQTAEPMEIGMRCALTFRLPGQEGCVHVIGRVVRCVPSNPGRSDEEIRIPGMGLEFERFGGPTDRSAIESYLHQNESATLRPETGLMSL